MHKNPMENERYSFVFNIVSQVRCRNERRILSLIRWPYIVKIDKRKSGRARYIINVLASKKTVSLTSSDVLNNTEVSDVCADLVNSTYVELLVVENESGNVIFTGRGDVSTEISPQAQGVFLEFSEDKIRIRTPNSRAYAEVPIDKIQITLQNDMNQNLEKCKKQEIAVLRMARDLVFGKGYEYTKPMAADWWETFFHTSSRMHQADQLGIDFGAIQVDPSRTMPGLEMPLGTSVTQLPQFKSKQIDIFDGRRSIRRYEQKLIKLNELQGLLNSVLGIQSRSINNFGLEVAKRPVPAAGGIQEIEAFSILNLGNEKYKVLYFSWTSNHFIESNAPVSQVRTLLETASASINTKVMVPGLILLAARKDRIDAKYQGISYASSLKHVGAITLALQLAAPHFGLGVCPLGSLPTEMFQKVISPFSTDLLPVGECTIGNIHITEE